MAESELQAGVADREDVGTTFRRWATDHLGGTWPGSQPGSDVATRGILDALLGPAYAPPRRTRPSQRANERRVSMVAATAMRDVLATWRETERELAATAEDSPEWPHVNARLISLRVAYRRLFDEATEPR